MATASLGRLEAFERAHGAEGWAWARAERFLIGSDLRLSEASRLPAAESEVLVRESPARRSLATASAPRLEAFERAHGAEGWAWARAERFLIGSDLRLSAAARLPATESEVLVRESPARRPLATVSVPRVEALERAHGAEGWAWARAERFLIGSDLRLSDATRLPATESEGLVRELPARRSLATVSVPRVEAFERAHGAEGWTRASAERVLAERDSGLAVA